MSVRVEVGLQSFRTPVRRDQLRVAMASGIGQSQSAESIAQQCVRKVHPQDMWGHTTEAAIAIQLGAPEALAGGMVPKLNQEMLPGRAIRSGRFGSSQRWQEFQIGKLC